MTSGSDSPDRANEPRDRESDWLRAPDDAGMVTVSVRVPPGAQLDPELQQKLDDVLRTLQESLEQPVQGLTCSQGNCRPFTSGECKWFVSCRIVD
jgi:hypothetical protein